MLILRRDILKKYLSKFKTSRISIDKIAKGSEGLTGAYLREVVTTAYLITIENGDEEITSKVLEESLNQVKKMKEIDPKGNRCNGYTH